MKKVFLVVASRLAPRSSSRFFLSFSLGLVLVLVLAAAGAPAFAQSCNAVARPDEPARSLVVTGTSLAVEIDSDNERSVITLGSMKNSSATCFRDLMVEVKYFDAKGQNIDTYTQTISRFHSPPGSEIGFRLWDHALKPREAYASQTLRVVSARPMVIEKETPAQPERTFVKVLIDWFPMLLLIGVWVAFMWRLSRKGSPQHRQLAVLEKQGASIETQNRLLERLAVALETRAQP